MLFPLYGNEAQIKLPEVTQLVDGKSSIECRQSDSMAKSLNYPLIRVKPAVSRVQLF